jgi:pimeloyl-ACP methyl ester carboxylesterase
MSYVLYKNKKIHYIAEGSGRPIIFLPGNTASSAAHQKDVESYSKRYLAASIDFLGTGASQRISPWPVDWWDEGAGQTATLIDELGGNKALLVGTSGGAVIALKTALLFPDKVSAVLADSFSLEMSRDMFESNVRRERADINDEKAAFWHFMHGEDWPEVIREDSDMIEKFVGEKSGRWFPDGLGELNCPALFTASLQDSSIADPATEMQRAIGQARRASLYLHHSGGHPLMWTAPQTFTSLLEAFLKELGW